MGRYETYGSRISELVKSRFSQYIQAKEAYDAAKKRKEIFPLRTGFGFTEREQLEGQKADLAFKDQQVKFKEATETLINTMSEFDELKSELVEQLKKDYAIDPASLDKNVVTLVSSDVCTADEIVNIYESSNVTTRRWLAKYASDRVEKLLAEDDGGESKELHKNRMSRQTLLRVVERAKEYTDIENSSTMQHVNTIRFALERTLSNTEMIPDWDNLTASSFSEL